MERMSGRAKRGQDSETRSGRHISIEFFTIFIYSMISSSPAICVGSQTFLLWTLDHRYEPPNNINHNSTELP